MRTEEVSIACDQCPATKNGKSAGRITQPAKLFSLQSCSEDIIICRLICAAEDGKLDVFKLAFHLCQHVPICLCHHCRVILERTTAERAKYNSVHALVSSNGQDMTGATVL